MRGRVSVHRNPFSMANRGLLPVSLAKTHSTNADVIPLSRPFGSILPNQLSSYNAAAQNCIRDRIIVYSAFRLLVGSSPGFEFTCSASIT
jgi:hypothetical protein